MSEDLLFHNASTGFYDGAKYSLVKKFRDSFTQQITTIEELSTRPQESVVVDLTLRGYFKKFSELNPEFRHLPYRYNLFIYQQLTHLKEKLNDNGITSSFLNSKLKEIRKQLVGKNLKESIYDELFFIFVKRHNASMIEHQDEIKAIDEEIKACISILNTANNLIKDKLKNSIINLVTTIQSTKSDKEGVNLKKAIEELNKFLKIEAPVSVNLPLETETPKTKKNRKKEKKNNAEESKETQSPISAPSKVFTGLTLAGMFLTNSSGADAAETQTRGSEFALTGMQANGAALGTTYNVFNGTQGPHSLVGLDQYPPATNRTAVTGLLNGEQQLGYRIFENGVPIGNAVYFGDDPSNNVTISGVQSKTFKGNQIKVWQRGNTIYRNEVDLNGNHTTPVPVIKVPEGLIGAPLLSVLGDGRQTIAWKTPTALNMQAFDSNGTAVGPVFTQFNPPNDANADAPRLLQTIPLNSTELGIICAQPKSAGTSSFTAQILKIGDDGISRNPQQFATTITAAYDREAAFGPIGSHGKSVELTYDRNVRNQGITLFRCEASFAGGEVKFSEEIQLSAEDDHIPHSVLARQDFEIGNRNNTAYIYESRTSSNTRGIWLAIYDNNNPQSTSYERLGSIDANGQPREPNGPSSPSFITLGNGQTIAAWCETDGMLFIQGINLNKTGAIPIRDKLWNGLPIAGRAPYEIEPFGSGTGAEISWVGESQSGISVLFAAFPDIFAQRIVPTPTVRPTENPTDAPTVRPTSNGPTLSPTSTPKPTNAPKARGKRSSLLGIILGLVGAAIAGLAALGTGIYIYNARRRARLQTEKDLEGGGQTRTPGESTPLITSNSESRVESAPALNLEEESPYLKEEEEQKQNPATNRIDFGNQTTYFQASAKFMKPEKGSERREKSKKDMNISAPIPNQKSEYEITYKKLQQERRKIGPQGAECYILSHPKPKDDIETQIQKNELNKFGDTTHLSLKNTFKKANNGEYIISGALPREQTGGGDGGNVYLGYRQLNGEIQYLAIKEILGPNNQDPEQLRAWLSEVESERDLHQSFLKHNNEELKAAVAPLIFVHIEKRSDGKWVAYHVTEFMPNGTLENAIKQIHKQIDAVKRKLEGNQIKGTLRSNEELRLNSLYYALNYLMLSTALSFLCVREIGKVAHKDLKPGNFLVGKDGSSKLIDFTHRLHINEENPRVNFQDIISNGPYGDPRYFSPDRRKTHLRAYQAYDETVQENQKFNYQPKDAAYMDSYNSAADDAWVLGLVLCEIALGRHPIDPDLQLDKQGGAVRIVLETWTDKYLKEKIEASFAEIEKNNAVFGKEIVSMLRKLLNFNENERAALKLTNEDKNVVIQMLKKLVEPPLNVSQNSAIPRSSPTQAVARTLDTCRKAGSDESSKKVRSHDVSSSEQKVRNTSLSTGLYAGQRQTLNQEGEKETLYGVMPKNPAQLVNKAGDAYKGSAYIGTPSLPGRT